jgi:photosystem II stability/assembly factor-like uncharacterized protein
MKLPLSPQRIAAALALFFGLAFVAAGCISFDAVEFAGGSNGWAAGEHNIIRTNDGGQTWVTQYSGSDHIVGLNFIDNQHGWAVGDQSLLITTDGGTTWAPGGEPARPLLKVTFVSLTQGYGVASGSVNNPGSLVATDDGGHSWRAVSTPDPVGDVCFRNANEGWIGAITPKGPGEMINGLAVLHTVDGGASWHTQLVVPPEDLLSAGGPSFPGNVVAAQLRCASDAVWFLGLGLPAHNLVRSYRVYRMDSSGSWALRLAYPPTDVTQPGPAMGPLTFAAPDGSTAYVAGVCGACGQPAYITRTGNGGQSWSNVAIPDGLTPSTTFHLSFVSPTEGWLATHSDNANIPGKVFHTTDGGQHWVKQFG